MLTEYLLASPLHAVGIWATLLVLDYLLPLLGGQILRRYADERIQPEFHRMNPVYMERRRGFLRFVGALTLPGLVLAATWFVLPRLYLWLCGALLFPRLMLVLRHKRSLSALIGLKIMPGAVEGGVRYTKAYIYRSSASDLAGSALLLGLAWSLAPHPAFLGGCVALVALAVLHYQRGLSSRRLPELRA